MVLRESLSWFLAIFATFRIANFSNPLIFLHGWYCLFDLKLSTWHQWIESLINHSKGNRKSFSHK
jgi:hypothetical protein